VSGQTSKTGAEHALRAPLTIPPAGTNIGAAMNREAFTRLKLAHGSGMLHTDIAALYEFLKDQIVREAGGNWIADRAECVDGSVLFLGRPHLLVISMTGIFKGQMGGLVVWAGGTIKDGKFFFPAPNFDQAELKLC